VRPALTLFLLLLLSACATERSTTKPAEPSGAEATPSAGDPKRTAALATVEQARAMELQLKVAQASANARCTALEKRVVPLEEERAVGKRLTLPLLKKHGPLVDAVKHRELVAWVISVGQHLAQSSSRPQLTWTFAVIDNPKPASASTMGGYVFVTTGLLARLQNEAQLAGVLAHELAHVTLRHGVTTYNDVVRKQCEVAVTTQAMFERMPATSVPAELRQSMTRASPFKDDGSFDYAANDDGFMQMVLTMLWSLDADMGRKAPDEDAADVEAAHLLAFSGYDAREYEKFLVELGDAPRHPPSAERAQKLAALRERELKAFSHATWKPDVTARVAGLKK